MSASNKSMEVALSSRFPVSARAASVIVAAAALLSACGQTPNSKLSASAAGSSSSDNGYVVQDKTSPQTFEATGLVITPPDDAQKAQASVSADQAWQAVEKSQNPFFLNRTGQSYLRLVSYTNGHHGKENSDGTITPLYKDVVVWLVELPDIPFSVSPNGPAPASGDGAAPSYNPSAAPALIAVDARTGEVMESLQAAEFEQLAD